MKQILIVLAATMALSACVSAGGAPGTGGAAMAPAEAAFVGDWNGRLPSGKPVRVSVSQSGSVRYYYENRLQQVNSVKMTSTRLTFRAGTNGSTVSLTPDGAYVFTWGPTGEVTRATLRKS